MESSICTRKGSQTTSSSGPETEKKEKIALSSSSYSSSSTPKWKHEVFLSFHGPDTRLSFTDHLYDALKQKGILTFRDDEKLERREDISQDLFKAIQESLYAIVILSPNYATSKWCLKELAEIVKCKTQNKLRILPIFCDVDPSDVRKQTGTFGKAFENHAKNLETESWRVALTEVGAIAGWDLRNRHQATVIRQIVGDIFEKLSLRISSVHGELVGIDSRVKKMMNFLGLGLNDDVRFIGIHGMGGVGKTTLSEVIYNRYSHQFEGSSYLASVRESSGNQDLVCLQQKLLCQILKEREVDVQTVTSGATMIRNRIQHRKILIVLDDVSTDSQLEALAGSHDWFGPGSRIIVTSIDSHLLKRHAVTYLYEIDVLNNDEALELFSLSAFKKVCPDENFVDLSKSFINYAQGLPLALKDLGLSLFGKTIDVWNGALDQLKAQPMKKILDLLEIGFDRLELLQKELFLDIAFFFKGEELNGVVRETLESSGYYPGINIEVLKDKSLITISCFGRLEMHDLLQEMGKKIVWCESPIEPGQRSRLWHWQDILHVLKNNTGTNAVKGIVLKLPLNTKERLSIGGFSKMKNLRILKLGDIILAENLWDKLCTTIGLRHPLESIPTEELRIMEWEKYPFKSLPTNFQANKLVELNFSHSRNIKELWKGKKSFGSLKRLDMSWCSSLIKTPDFTEVQNLEVLDLFMCVNLSHVNQSIGGLKRLKKLDLVSCASVTNLPFDMRGLESLEELYLHECTKLEVLEMAGMKSLKALGLRNTLVKEFIVPCSTSHSFLNFNHCLGLEKFPDLSGLEFIDVFDARETAITNFPSPSLLPKKCGRITVSGRNPQAELGEVLWFHIHPSLQFHDIAWLGIIHSGDKENEIYSNNDVEGFYFKYGCEYDDKMLYFTLADDRRVEEERDIFDLEMTGASLGSSASRSFEWFNNETTTVVNFINYEFIPRVDHQKLKGISLFFAFEYHGPLHRKFLNYGPRRIPFACIFVSDEGILTEPLFLWAPAIHSVRPIEFWIFVPTMRFQKLFVRPTCSNCIWASVVPPRKLSKRTYYFPGTETESEIFLEESKARPLADVKDCKVRLVYEDDTSDFYSTVAPHALHSQYHEHPCCHPYDTDSYKEKQFYPIYDNDPRESDSD